MRIANYQTIETGKCGIGIVKEECLLDFTRTLQVHQAVSGEEVQSPCSIQQMIESGEFEAGIFEYIEEFADSTGLYEELFVAENYRLLAPIPRPPAIYALGRNFPAHAIEHAGELPSEPIFFSKASTSVVGPEDPVIYKKSLSRVDPEVELAVIIARQGSNISEGDANDYIAGYTIINDVTARELQQRDIAVSLPWFRSKGIDTFCPMGPYVLLANGIDEPLELDLAMRVNGEIRQKDNTRSLTFKVPYVISWISQYVTLNPGDVIAMGTPEGMKPVVPGDVMEAYVEKIGVLRNPVVAE